MLYIQPVVQQGLLHINIWCNLVKTVCSMKKLYIRHPIWRYRRANLCDTGHTGPEQVFITGSADTVPFEEDCEANLPYCNDYAKCRSLNT